MGALEMQALNAALEKQINFQIEQRVAAIVAQAVQQAVAQSVQQCRVDTSAFMTKTEKSGLVTNINDVLEKINVQIKNLERENKILQEKLEKKTEGETFKLMVESVGKKIDTLKNEVDTKISPLKTEIAGCKTQTASLRIEIENCRTQVSPLRAEIDSINKKLSAPTPLKMAREAAGPYSNGSAASAFDNVILMNFNGWASSPTSLLPSAFSYVTGEFHLRATSQQFSQTAQETAWIMNRERQKMLFPNPRLLDPMRDISELYKMDQSKVKPKGENKICIKKPCIITDTGYIEFPGELELL
ncbi:MAG: hypothetical protein LBT24_00600 [Tannerella sp.]|jgi:chaperonin cofactor prefoldin|nr:hypothetical protein [Tannerella sp.]